MDVSKSLHKCYKCNAKIFAVCAPQFEDTNEVHCRRCTLPIPTTAQPKITKQTLSEKKSTNKRRRKSTKKDICSESDSDRDDVTHRSNAISLPSRSSVRRSKSRPAALCSTSRSAEQLDGTRNYHDDPHLLFQSQVQRYFFNLYKFFRIYNIKNI